MLRRCAGKVNEQVWRRQQGDLHKRHQACHGTAHCFSQTEGLQRVPRTQRDSGAGARGGHGIRCGRRTQQARDGAKSGYHHAPRQVRSGHETGHEREHGGHNGGAHVDCKGVRGSNLE